MPSFLRRASGLGRRPFGAPAKSGAVHLVARVLRELDDKAVAAQPERLHTGVDQRLSKLGPLFRRRPRRMSHEMRATGSGSPALQLHIPPSPSSRNATVTRPGVVCMISA